MKKGIDLLNGPIAGSLARLALPIMGTSLIQMAYNLTDMLWIGRIGSNAVAAVGAAGMYIWLSAGFTMLARMGGQVLTAQSLGAGKEEKAVQYATASLQMGLLFGLLYGVISVIFNRPLIGFFRLNSPEVILDARWYLAVTCGGIVFNFINQILTGLLTAMGNSMITFWSTTIGLVINLVLDPVLIFGPGPLPRLGVKGAAAATVFAQIMVFSIYLLRIRRDALIFSKVRILQRPAVNRMKEILLVGLPASVQNFDFHRHLHADCENDRRLGRCSRCSPESRQPDRIHLLDDRGGIWQCSQCIYRAELWRRQKRPCQKRLLQRTQNHVHLGSFYDACAPSFPGNPVPPSSSRKQTSSQWAQTTCAFWLSHSFLCAQRPHPPEHSRDWAEHCRHL